MTKLNIKEVGKNRYNKDYIIIDLITKNRFLLYKEKAKVIYYDNRSILHNKIWNDIKALKILKKCYDKPSKNKVNIFNDYYYLLDTKLYGIYSYSKMYITLKAFYEIDSDTMLEIIITRKRIIPIIHTSNLHILDMFKNYMKILNRELDYII